MSIRVQGIASGAFRSRIQSKFSGLIDSSALMLVDRVVSRAHVGERVIILLAAA